MFLIIKFLVTGFEICGWSYIVSTKWIFRLRLGYNTEVVDFLKYEVKHSSHW